MKLRVDGKTVLYFLLVLIGASGFFLTLFLPHPAGFYAFVVVAALVGFGVSLNIYDTKRRGKQLVCPVGSDCNAVITSRYAKFLGVSLEYWGMGYFAFIALAYLALIFFKTMFAPIAILVLVLLSVGAGIFSLYLLFVQAFLLRQWCIWCILTAMMSLTIFITSLVSVNPVVSFLLDINAILEMFKFFGFSLGVGGVTATLFLFFHFLEDTRIDDKELNVIKGISELVWVGFGFVLVSQFAMYISSPETLAQSGAFLAQITSLLVFAVSGALLMIIYAPFLVYVPFRGVSQDDVKADFVKLRKPTAIIGALALLSWYFAFVMNFISELPFHLLLVIFAVLISLVTLFAVMWDKSLHTKKVL